MDSKVLISAAAGIPLYLYEHAIDDIRAAVILPNPPAGREAGTIPVTFNNSFLPEEKANERGRLSNTFSFHFCDVIVHSFFNEVRDRKSFVRMDIKQEAFVFVYKVEFKF